MLIGAAGCDEPSFPLFGDGNSCLPSPSPCGALDGGVGTDFYCQRSPPQRVLPGAELGLQIDFGFDFDDRTSREALRFESDAPEIVEVFESAGSGCVWRPWVAGHLRFLKVGKATVRVLNREGLARESFDIEVVDGASMSLRVQNVTRGGPYVDGGDARRVTGLFGDRFDVSAAPLDAEGGARWTNEVIEYSIDDPSLASLSSFDGSLSDEHALLLLAPGTTALHATLHRLSATLELVIERPPPESDAGAGAGADDDAGAPSL